MAHAAVAGPGGELHLSDELRLGPFGVFRIRPRHGDEGRGLAADALERGHDRAAELNAPAGADAARIDQAPAVVVADEERAQIRPPGGLAPIAADDKLVAQGAFRLEPVGAAAGPIGSVRALANDAFQVSPTC